MLLLQNFGLVRSSEALATPFVMRKAEERVLAAVYSHLSGSRRWKNAQGQHRRISNLVVKTCKAS